MKIKIPASRNRNLVFHPVGSHEHLLFHKKWKYLDQLIDYKLMNEGLVSWKWLGCDCLVSQLSVCTFT